MANLVFERRSLELTPEEWRRLERMASETFSLAPRGPKIGQSSWRTLMKRISDEELVVSERVNLVWECKECGHQIPVVVGLERRPAPCPVCDASADSLEVKHWQRQRPANG